MPSSNVKITKLGGYAPPSPASYAYACTYIKLTMGRMQPEYVQVAITQQ